MKEQIYLTRENIAQKHPAWLRSVFSVNKEFTDTQKLLKDKEVNSVCVEAVCPNKGECWKLRHITFLILGKVCTRNCSFCNVKAGEPEKLDFDEPQRIAETVKKLKAKYVVITSVTRDDLPDKGAGQFKKTVEEIKTGMPEVKIELLIPDFDAAPVLLEKIAFCGAEVIGHNIEMPSSLYPEVRPKADYNRSLKTLTLLKSMKEKGADILLKSSIIVGLGESERDVLFTLEDLLEAGVDIVYIGQYLSPSRRHWPVEKYYTPEEFKFFEKKAYEMGFGAVCAGPLVRSSYRAYESYLKCKAS